MCSSRGIGSGRASLCTDRQLSIIAVVPRDHASTNPLALSATVNVAPADPSTSQFTLSKSSPTVFVAIAICKWRGHGGWGRIQGQYLNGSVSARGLRQQHGRTLAVVFTSHQT